MTLLGPFQLRIFCDPVITVYNTHAFVKCITVVMIFFTILSLSGKLYLKMSNLSEFCLQKGGVQSSYKVASYYFLVTS